MRLFAIPVRPLVQALTLGLAIAAAGCSSGSSGPDDVDPDFGTNDPAVVVGLGDSITFGLFDGGAQTCDEGFRATVGYCPRLANLTGKRVINEGVCGETSNGGAARVRGVLQRYKPGVLLIDYSPNDLFNGSSAVIENLRSMITAARENKTVPIIGTLVPAVGEHLGWEPFIEDVNARIRALCLQENIEYADHWQAFKNNPGFARDPYTLLSADGLHPNTAGYQLMAGTWRWPLLRVY
jgi:lysophospholipase L1-like esterase